MQIKNKTGTHLNGSLLLFKKKTTGILILLDPPSEHAA